MTPGTLSVHRSGSHSSVDPSRSQNLPINETGFCKCFVEANGIVTPRLASKTTTIFKGYIHSQIMHIKDKMRIQVNIAS